MKDLININRLNRFGQNIWTRIKNTFMTKEDAINGVLVGQEWTLFGSVTGNSPIVLPSTDTFTELYIEMYSSNGTISHQQNIKIDSILFESSNNEYREILLDSVYDAQTYVRYDFVSNSIIPIMYEGNEITDSSNITTRVYTKTNNIEVGNIEAEKIVYDNSFSDVSANNVQDVIDEISRTLGYTMSKNLLKFPYDKTSMQSSGTYSANGIVWTINNDGSVSCSGTSNADESNIVLWNRISSPLKLKKGKYILSGCPKGGSANTYSLVMVKTAGDTYEIVANDFGEGAEFELTEDTNVGVLCKVWNSGVNLNENHTYYPMIRYASIEDDTFVPYISSVKEHLSNSNWKYGGLIEGTNIVELTNICPNWLELEFFMPMYTDGNTTFCHKFNIKRYELEGSNPVNTTQRYLYDGYYFSANSHASGTIEVRTNKVRNVYRYHNGTDLINTTKTIFYWR